MAKRKSPHPIEVVRRAMKKSRPQFAVRIGCTEHAIKRIENGKLKLSEKLARAVYDETGANPNELLIGRAIDFRGFPYSDESWRARQESGNALQMPSTPENILGWVRFVLEVAQDRRKLRPVYHSLADWLEEARENFNLGPAIDQELRFRKFKETESRTVAQWRINKPLAQFFGFKDSGKLDENQVITLSKEVRVPWCPLVPPPPSHR